MEETVQSVHAWTRASKSHKASRIWAASFITVGSLAADSLEGLVCPHLATDSLSASTWRCLYLCRVANIRIFKSHVLPGLLYGCQTWTVNEGLERRIDVFGNECLRWVTGLRWNDLVSNRRLHLDTDSTSITCIVRPRHALMLILSIWLSEIDFLDVVGI